MFKVLRQSLFLLWLFAVCVPAFAENQATSDPFQEDVFPISTYPTGQMFPSASKTLVTWQDGRHDSGSFTNADIYAFDLVQKIEFPISINPASQLSPIVSSSKIAWTDYRFSSANSAVFVYDLMSASEEQVNTTPANFESMDGNFITWTQDLGRDHALDIYLYDLTTKLTRPIANTSLYEAESDISGDKVVYIAYVGSGISDVFLYNDTTKETKNLTANAPRTIRHHPRISDHWIVWEDSRNGSIDIYTYDMNTGQEKPIVVEGPSNQMWPAIWKNHVVYMDGRNGKDWNIYHYDLLTEKETQVTSDPSSQFYPDINDGIIVWSDQRLGYLNIFGSYFQDVAPPVVTDDGQYGPSLTQLHASWTFNWPGSVVSDYSYRITQDKTDGPVIRDWTSVEATTSVTVKNLQLQLGKTYYFAVRARNTNQELSPVGCSDGITVFDGKRHAAIQLTYNPTSVTFGNPIIVSAKVTNIGSMIWTTDVFHCRPHATLPSGKYVRDVKGTGFTLPKNVTPGETVDIKMSIPTGKNTSINETGSSCIIALDMAQEQVAWFKNEASFKLKINKT